MGIPITRNFVDMVRDAADIVRIVSDYVPLKQAGARLKGLCPFHDEKTPSFTVDPDRKLFYCFGCQTGGDLFKFVMLYEGIDFPKAVESVAAKCGIPMPKEGGRASAKDDARARVLRMNSEAESFYRNLLLKEDAGRKCRAYLESRGITRETIDRLCLGCAPDSWDALLTHLGARRFRPDELVRAGLAVRRKSGTGQYDRFRDRLIFPIRDLSKRTVAFGARALSEETEPKYLNSPETAAYVKGEHLYGLDQARETIRREGYAIVVEGYIDLAALVQAGFSNVVASLGTSFTPAQARLLARYTGRVVVSYDGDAAGSSAAIRSLDLLLSRGFEVRVVDLPAGMDPDDHIREHGAESFGRLLRQAPGYLDFLIRKETRGRDFDRIEEKTAVINAVLPHLAKLGSAIERSAWADRLADITGLPKDGLVQQELRTALREARPGIRQAAATPEGPRPVEKRLVSLLLKYPEARRLAADRLETSDLAGSRIEKIVSTILHMEENGQTVNHQALFTELASEEDRNLLTRIAFDEEPDGLADELEDCARVLRRERLIREQQDVRKAIEVNTDPSALDSLLARTQSLARQIDALS